MDEQICREFAERAVSDDCVPEWFKQTALWYQQGFVDCEELKAGMTYLANQGIICGELQQDVQLVALGDSTTDRAREIKGLWDWLKAEQERLELDKEANRKELDLIHQNLVNLGGAVSDASGAATTGNILGGLGLGAGIGGLILIFLLLRSRR